MSVNQTKFNTINQRRKDTTKGVSRAVSELNKHTTDALKQQAYIRTNPDDNGADELIPIVQVDFDALVIALAEVQGKLNDLTAVRNGALSVEDSVTKYNINLDEFSDELL